MITETLPSTSSFALVLEISKIHLAVNGDGASTAATEKNPESANVALSGFLSLVSQNE
jgi:hypothetical protein